MNDKFTPVDAAPVLPISRGKCAGCGEEVEIDVPPNGHTRAEHDAPSTHDEHGGCRTCPVAVLCGPVTAETDSKPGDSVDTPTVDAYADAADCRDLQIGEGEWKEQQATWEGLDKREVWNKAVCRCAETIEERWPKLVAPTWICACGWSGVVSQLKPNASGGNVCPSCGASGGLVLAPKLVAPLPTRHAFTPYKRTPYCGHALSATTGHRCGELRTASAHLSDDIVNDRFVPIESLPTPLEEEIAAIEARWDAASPPWSSIPFARTDIPRLIEIIRPLVAQRDALVKYFWAVRALQSELTDEAISVVNELAMEALSLVKGDTKDEE